MKLFLYSSYKIKPEHSLALSRLVGKDPKEITFAVIDNALDVEEGSEEWLPDTHASLEQHGAKIEVVDLRNWLHGEKGLREKLASKDVIWVCGGHGFYLRWILKASGADEIIKELVAKGKVYSGWSAGSVLAGPTLKFFDLFDHPDKAPEAIWDALGLTQTVVVPHLDLPDFTEGMKQINEQLKQTGYTTAPLTDDMALIIDGDKQEIIH